MPKNVTLIAPDGEKLSVPVEDGHFSLPWLHPYARMNGTWIINDTGYPFDITLPYNDPEQQAQAEVTQ